MKTEVKYILESNKEFECDIYFKLKNIVIYEKNNGNYITILDLKFNEFDEIIEIYNKEKSNESN